MTQLLSNAILAWAVFSVAMATSGSFLLNRLRKLYPDIYAKWKDADIVLVAPWDIGEVFYFARYFASFRQFRQHDFDSTTTFWCEVLFLSAWASLFSFIFVCFGAVREVL